jgi:nitrate reductase (NAD(P)H)
MLIRVPPIDSENAKAMMPDYHIGTLDAASRVALADGDTAAEENDLTRAVFLQSKTWSKAILESKTKVSSDSFIFGFKLDHADQQIGLPTGQHLLLRLREPVTREAIIRAYTPLSEENERGLLRILIKVYYNTQSHKGGKMTMALNAIPVGHSVDFKGPVGKFVYLGGGRCTISDKERRVRRLVMICGGSGITPIFQVLRAVMKDVQDPTECVVLDGNRVEEDILCKKELDAMAASNRQRCRIIYTLSRPGSLWTGRTGRVDRPLLSSEIGPPRPSNQNGGDMVLICGPSSLEESVHEILLDIGWREEDLLFF